MAHNTLERSTVIETCRVTEYEVERYIRQLVAEGILLNYWTPSGQHLTAVHPHQMRLGFTSLNEKGK